MASLTEAARAIRDRFRSEPVGRLTLIDFACSGRVIRVFSEVLGEEMLMAADDADVTLWMKTHSGASQPTIYRARELSLLLDASPSALVLLHEVKRRFNAEIEVDC